MTLEEIVRVLNCDVISGGGKLDTEVHVGCGADLMSDVLAFIKPDSLLLTGLANAHSVRTADIAEVKAIVYVRGKQPNRDAVAIAEEKGIPLLSTKLLMYEACGRLYKSGLAGGSEI
jgi:predicted transcriptional regulator